MTDEQNKLLRGVVREAINSVLKHPFALLSEREQCLRVALAALDTIDELAASAAPAVDESANLHRNQVDETRNLHKGSAAPEGEVVVSKHPDGRIVAVTRQDAEGRILKVIAEASAAPAAPALICKSCGADRFKEDCKGNRQNCGIRGEAQSAAPVASAAPVVPEDQEATFEVIQGGMVVAAASGPRKDALREAQHYAAVYGQDGPVGIREKTRRRAKK